MVKDGTISISLAISLLCKYSQHVSAFWVVPTDPIIITRVGWRTIRPDNLQTDNRNGKKKSSLHDEIMKSFPFLREWEEIVYVSCWKPTTFCYFTVKREIKEIGSETFTCPAFTWITGCVKRHQKFLTGPTIIFASISSSTRGNCRCLNVHSLLARWNRWTDSDIWNICTLSV